MPDEFDPNTAFGLQAYQMSHQAAPDDHAPPERKGLAERIRRVHWVVKLVVGALVFGAVSWVVGSQLVDRVVANQQPLLSGATDQVKESFRRDFDGGVCDLKRELVQQSQDLQRVATERIDRFQHEVYRQLGIETSTTTTIAPSDDGSTTTASTTTIPPDCPG